MITDKEAEGIVHDLITEISDINDINVGIHDLGKIFTPARIMIYGGASREQVKEVLKALICYYEMKE